MNAPHFLRFTSGYRRSAPLLLLAGLLVAVATPVWFPGAVRADEPVRSGTILGGVGETPASLYVRGLEGCVGAPTCAAWLQSACHPSLAGTDPALHAAIVDVGDLADGVTEHVLRMRDGVGLNWGHFIVQFWDHTSLGVPLGRPWEWCSEILDRRMSNWDGGTQRGRSWSFEIPRGAQWMTITSSPDNTDINWMLT